MRACVCVCCAHALLAVVAAFLRCPCVCARVKCPGRGEGGAADGPRHVRLWHGRRQNNALLRQLLRPHSRRVCGKKLASQQLKSLSNKSIEKKRRRPAEGSRCPWSTSVPAAWGRGQRAARCWVLAGAGAGAAGDTRAGPPPPPVCFCMSVPRPARREAAADACVRSGVVAARGRRLPRHVAG